MANTIKLKRGTSTPSVSDISNGEVAIDTSAKKLYINDSGTVKEIGGSGTIGGASGLDFNDDVKVRFGTGNDLEIYHNALNSYVVNSTGWLVLGNGGSGTVIKGAADENAVACTVNGAVEIYYDSSKKFETTSVGVKLGAGSFGSVSTYYDDIVIDNSDNASGASGGAGVTLVSGNNTWGSLSFSDSDADQRGAIKYNHQVDKLYLLSAATTAVEIDSSQNATFAGALTVNSEINARRLTLSDDGSSSPTFMLKTDDDSPWGFTIKNDNYSTSTDIGFRGYQANSGDFFIRLNGNSEYNNFYIQQHNGTTNRTLLTFNTSGNATFSGSVTTAGTFTLTGNADISGYVNVGGNNSHFSENNLRFKSAGHAYIDHNTTSQSIYFRVSNSSSNDTNALILAPSGNATFAANVAAGTFNSFATSQSGGINKVLVSGSDGYLYLNNWMRVGDGDGLFAPGGSHLYNAGASTWKSWINRSTHSSACGIGMESSDGTDRGWAYATDSYVGFLNASGNWLFRAPQGNNSAPETGAGHTIWHSGNDGSGSGLSADKWDGYEFSDYLNQSVLTTSSPTFAQVYCDNWFRNQGTSEGLYNQGTDAHFYSAGNNYWHINGNSGDIDHGALILYDRYNSTHGNATGRKGYLYWDTNGFGLLHSGGNWIVRGNTSNTDLYGNLRHGGSNTIWHAGNDGPGSGLNADTLDNVEGANYVRTDQNTTITSDLFIGGGGGGLTINAASDIRLTSGAWTGNVAGKIQHHSNWLYLVAGTSGIVFRCGNGSTDEWYIQNDGTLYPASDAGASLGKSGNRVNDLFTNWLSTTSGDRSSTKPSRFYASDDSWVRYYNMLYMRMWLGLSTRDGDDARADHTTDTNYWVGAKGWGTTAMNDLMGKGNVFWDTWSNPNGQPSGTSHWTGFNALHYTNRGSSGTGSGGAYGWQMTMGAGSPALTYLRGNWSSGNLGTPTWYKVWNEANDGHSSGLDADLWDGWDRDTYLNQGVRSDSTPTFSNIYTSAWFRNNDSGEGLYNTATTQHFYTDHDDCWNVAGGSTSGFIRIRDEHAGTIRGYVGANNSNAVGFLDYEGNWAWASGKFTNYSYKDLAASPDDSHDLGYGNRRWDNVYATNGTIQTSDRNEKENIVATDLGLAFVNKLNPVSFKRKGKTRTHYGFIAQDIEQIITDLGKTTTQFAPLIKSDISEAKDGSEYRYGLRYEQLLAPVVKSIQELSDKVTELATKVAALESA